MSDKNSTKKPKRPSKGQRKHIRRLKQLARKEATTKNPQSSPPQPVRVTRSRTNPSEGDTLFFQIFRHPELYDFTDDIIRHGFVQRKVHRPFRPR
jgi:hypothetical protein